MGNFQRLTTIGLLFATCMTAGCDRTPLAPLEYGPQPGAAQQTVYRFAVHPLYNPARLAHAYQPLVNELNRRVPQARFELEASRDYQSYEAKIAARDAAVLLPNPWQTLQATKVGYRVIAMAGDAEDFKGIFIVRKDSPVQTPTDLKGKVVSYPSHTALAACILPQYFLHQHGINIRRDLQNQYVGSQESSILNVYLGLSAAGATWPPPWRLFQQDHPEEAAQLRVIWETPPLLNNSVMVRDDVPVEVADRILQVLLQLQDTEEGRKALTEMSTARFHPADDSTYLAVQNYVDRFEQAVRRVTQP